MGKLYLIPTPIGNLDDITIRAVEMLKEVVLVAAEDTRVSRKLLNHLGIKKPMVAYHEFNKEDQLPKIMDALKRGDVGLISDAGMPGISDPGYELVKAAIERNIVVIPLPGPTALIPALVGSGLPTDKFVFLGFLPKKQGAQEKLLAEFVTDKKTLILYESPYRLSGTLKLIGKVLGDRRACVAREISKKYEEFVRGRVSELIGQLEKQQLAGEVVVVIEGAREKVVWDEMRVGDELKKGMNEGEGLAQVARKVAAESGWKRREVYELGLGMKREQ